MLMAVVGVAGLDLLKAVPDAIVIADRRGRLPIAGKQAAA